MTIFPQAGSIESPNDVKYFISVDSVSDHFRLFGFLLQIGNNAFHFLNDGQLVWAARHLVDFLQVPDFVVD